MIQGIGVDIVELSRIKGMLERQPRMIERVLTNSEREAAEALRSEIRRIEYIAGRFAAKEAFAKAIGTGLGKLSFQDIEIINNSSGAPVLNSNVLTGQKCFISISHSEQYAIAQVIIEA
ncbi:holo-ACP synthase [Gracilibacillus caseinilyticus]|uniref:Holo-[acyl-carrier-protein] synthase n=1 Tax=Gracilibacillus caseinilyticus TaxID=2932256 RepID=A0ABY4EXJ1_9BACI|nr:holo-ACP synthase [Gracilibacillus caseinilyticus]UOQ49131.1 holo-ACP synthase [Gracilibacillus caseinilyticus]